jgi:hypothetical protein
VQPLHLLRRGHAACHYADGRRALSAFNASRPIRWQAVSRSSSRWRACWVCWQNSAPVPSGALYSSSLLQEASPARRGYADLGCQGTRGLSRQQTLVGPKHYIPYVPGPTCRGPVPLCMPPFSYKRGGMRRYTHATLGHTLDSQAHKQYISQWSRVLRSGGPNHSKSLCVLEFFPFIPTIKQNA